MKIREDFEVSYYLMIDLMTLIIVIVVVLLIAIILGR